MAEKPPLTYEEIRRILHRLEPLLAERRIIRVGGQAVAFWTRYLESQSGRLESESGRPTAADSLTSKDIDFEGSARSVTHAATLLAAFVNSTVPDYTTRSTNSTASLDSTADGKRPRASCVPAPTAGKDRAQPQRRFK